MNRQPMDKDEVRDERSQAKLSLPGSSKKNNGGAKASQLVAGGREELEK